MVLLGILSHPGRQLSHNRILDFLASCIDLAVHSDQITRVESSRDDLHWNLLGALQWSIWSQVRRDRCFSPRIVPSIDVDQTGGVIDVPASGVGVDFIFGLALCNTIILSVWSFGEVQSTLPSPVLCGHKSADDGRPAFWSAVLPVTEGLVASHPDPLTIDGVAQRSIGVHWITGVVGVEAANVVVVFPVAVSGAHARELHFLPPFGVAGESFCQSYPVWTCYSLPGGVDGVLDVVTPCIETLQQR